MTAMTQGIISLLNLDLKNAHPFLLFIDGGVKYPAIKNMADITKISITRLRISNKLLFEGSETIQKRVPNPLLS
jgi:hypothetical protein